jgi:hypothetical protein
MGPKPPRATNTPQGYIRRRSVFLLLFTGAITGYVGGRGNTTTGRPEAVDGAALLDDLAHTYCPGEARRNHLVRRVKSTGGRVRCPTATVATRSHPHAMSRAMPRPSIPRQ